MGAGAGRVRLCGWVQRSEPGARGWGAAEARKHGRCLAALVGAPVAGDAQRSSTWRLRQTPLPLSPPRRRALALGQLRSSDVWLVIRKEALAGAAMGGGLGLLIFGFSFLWSGMTMEVGLTVAIALPVGGGAGGARGGWRLAWGAAAWRIGSHRPVQVAFRCAPGDGELGWDGCAAAARSRQGWLACALSVWALPGERKPV